MYRYTKLQYILTKIHPILRNSLFSKDNNIIIIILVRVPITRLVEKFFTVHFILYFFIFCFTWWVMKFTKKTLTSNLAFCSL